MLFSSPRHVHGPDCPLASRRFQTQDLDDQFPISVGCCAARANAQRRWRLSVNGKYRAWYPFDETAPWAKSGPPLASSGFSCVALRRARAMKRRAARPVWNGSRGARGRPGRNHHGGDSYSSSAAYQSSEARQERPVAEERWSSAEQQAQADEAMQREGPAVAAEAEWEAPNDVLEIKVRLAEHDEAVGVTLVVSAATEAEASKAVQMLESCTKALVAMTAAQCEAKILAGLSQVSTKVEAEEGLLVQDKLEVARTCASGGRRLVLRGHSAPAYRVARVIPSLCT
jgi:hypothetical protein